MTRPDKWSGRSEESVAESKRGGGEMEKTDTVSEGDKKAQGDGDRKRQRRDLPRPG